MCHLISLVDSKLFDGWMNLFSHDALFPDGSLTFRSLAGKHPIICRREERHFPPLLQHLGLEGTHGGWAWPTTQSYTD